MWVQGIAIAVFRWRGVAAEYARIGVLVVLRFSAEWQSMNVYVWLMLIANVSALSLTGGSTAAAKPARHPFHHQSVHKEKGFIYRSGATVTFS